MRLTLIAFTAAALVPVTMSRGQETSPPDPASGSQVSTVHSTASVALQPPLHPDRQGSGPSSRSSTTGGAGGGGSSRRSANLILNGDFEINTASGCDFNQPNSSFNMKMSNCTAFGTAEEIDIMKDAAGCGYEDPPVSGVTKLGIHTVSPFGTFDAFSFTLSSAVVAGKAYYLEFWAEASTLFDPDDGAVEVGISSSATAFGTQIFSGTPAVGVWTKFTYSFIAPVGGGFLTVRQTLSEEAWEHIDAFVLSSIDPFVVDPGTIIAEDSAAPGSGGPYTLIKYDTAGNKLQTLVINDTVGLGIPDGVAVIGGDVFVAGTSGAVAQIELETGNTIHGVFGSGGGTEALGDLNGDLLIGQFSGNIVEVWRRDGTFVRTITPSNNVGMTGVDSDGRLLYLGSYNDGNIYVYDLNGNLLRTVPTGIGGGAVSGLGIDRNRKTVWVSTGFNQDDVREYDLSGNLLRQFPANSPFLDGMDFADNRLILNIEPNFTVAGSTVEFRTYYGPKGKGAATFISSVNGAPIFIPILIGLYDATNSFSFKAKVPPGIAGFVVGHVTFGIDFSGKVVMSNEELVFHQ